MAELEQKNETESGAETRTPAPSRLLGSAPFALPVAPRHPDRFRNVYTRVRSRLVDPSFVEVVGSQGLDGE